MVTEIIKNLRYYISTDLKTLKSMNATSQVCFKRGPWCTNGLEHFELLGFPWTTQYPLFYDQSFTGILVSITF